MNFCLLWLEAFDDSADPMKHIVTFYAQISLYGTLNALMCYTFSTMLRDLARVWYAHLKLLSINSFAQLMGEFEFYFLKNIRSKLSTVILLGLKQGQKKILVDFVTQFTNKIQGMVDAHWSLIIYDFYDEA